MDIDLSVVNQHYLQNVVNLGKTREVIVSDDIYDAKGAKLLARGAQVRDSVYDRLVRFKLAKPLEASLTVHDGISKDTIVAEAKKLLEENETLSGCVAASNSAAALFAILHSLTLDGVTTLLLSMVENRGPGMLRHSVLTAVLATVLGIRLKFSPDDLRHLALAGLLHDIGELYIDPDFLKPGRELTPAEWRNIAVHPRVGELVLSELTQYPKEIARTVAEHHERFNGYGYPRRLKGHQISKFGSVLSVAETVGGILLKKDRPVERACLAVKMVPGDYDSELVSILLRLGCDTALSCQRPPAPSQALADLVNMAERLHACLHAVLTEIANATAPNQSHDDDLETILDYSRNRVLMLQNTLHAVGITAKGFFDAVSCNDMDIVLEAEVVLMETQWRLRELARQLYLRATTLLLKEPSMARLAPLCEALTTY